MYTYTHTDTHTYTQIGHAGQLWHIINNDNYLSDNKYGYSAYIKAMHLSMYCLNTIKLISILDCRKIPSYIRKLIKPSIGENLGSAETKACMLIKLFTTINNKQLTINNI